MMIHVQFPSSFIQALIEPLPCSKGLGDTSDGTPETLALPQPALGTGWWGWGSGDGGWGENF